MRLNVFISYSHKDRDALELVQRLQPFVLAGEISVSFDGDIGGGQAWQERIRDRLVEADVAILALSSNYFESKHCEREIKHALRLANDAGLRAVPVMLEVVPLGGWPLVKRLQVVPSAGTTARDSWDLTIKMIGDAMADVRKDRERTLGRIRPEEYDHDIGTQMGVLSFDHMTRAATILERQMHTGVAFDPDVIIGLNEGGTFLAMALRRTLRKPVGCIGFKRGSGGEIDYVSLPQAWPTRTGLSVLMPKRVLVADAKLKSGATLRSLEGFLKDHYGSFEVRFAIALAYEGWTAARWMVDSGKPRWPATFRPLNLRAYVAWYTDRRKEDDDIVESPRA